MNKKPPNKSQNDKTNWGKEIAHSGKIAGTVTGKVFSYIINILLTILLVGLITGTIVGGAFAIYIKNYIVPEVDDFIKEFDLLTANQNMTSKIYYMDYSTNANGVPVEMEDQRLHGGENRLGVQYKDIPTYLIEAFVAIEDVRFWDHKGVDWLRTASATLGFFLPSDKKHGGSTLTQQLIKNVTGEDSVSIQRKVTEMLRALSLEKKKDKSEILELYLNTIYLSQHSYGVQAAANMYFSKDISELNLIECAAIAAIPQNPLKWDPIRNPENNKQRRDLILKEMLKQGKITQQEYDATYDRELVLNVQVKKEGTATNSWFTDQVINDVIQTLMTQKNYTRELASRMIYTQGFHIYTTMSPEVQTVLEEVYKDDANFPEVKSNIKPESAMVVMNPYNGDVLGLVGGRGEKKQDLIWNRATHTKRQPGSAIKPITVYAPAMDKGLITYGSVFDDAPVDFISGSRAWPKNNPRVYNGLTTINSAVERSVNTIAVEVLKKLTVQDSFSFAKNKLQINSLIDRKELPSGKVVTDMDLATLGLGALTYGLSVEEITAAYSIFVNKGIYSSPRTFTKVLDNKGNVIINNEIDPIIAVSEQTASIMTKMLSNVVTRGTAKSVTLKEYVNVAGKTGTTDEDKDRWFVGYTPYYVGGVWFGYDTPKNVGTLSSNPPNNIWDIVMTKLHQKYIDEANKGGTPLKEFVTAEGIITATYCKDSGKLMTSACKADPRGNRAEVGYFKKSTEPYSYCDVHILVDYDSSTNAIAQAGCPSDVITQVGLIKNSSREFPTQVTITDAQYVYRNVPNGTPYGGWWGVPFFNNTIPSGVYVGVSSVERLFNHACYKEGHLFKKEETKPPEETTGNTEFEDTTGTEEETSSNIDSGDIDTNTETSNETTTVDTTTVTVDSTDETTKSSGPPEGYIW